MRKIFLTTTLLVLMAGPAAIAQTKDRTANPSSQKQMPWPAPVGHRQPRVDQVPSEKDLGNPNDAANREDAVLDRKIKSICRGC
ncbi:hypothetical protein [Bradyrhizobium sp.]|uniref:hypothetical protein n=1 Tax=Bradyrhizobium sp. TaxID=376 RepID=UPI003C7326C7